MVVVVVVVVVVVGVVVVVVVVVAVVVSRYLDCLVLRILDQSNEGDNMVLSHFEKSRPVP